MTTSARYNQRIINVCLVTIWCAALFIFSILGVGVECYPGLYVTCLLSFAFIGFACILRSYRKQLDLFEPLTMVTVLYVTMFCVVPMYDLLIGNILHKGVDLMPYGVWATLIANVGYFVFFLFYNANNHTSLFDVKIDDSNVKCGRVSVLSIVLFFGCEFFSIVGYVLEGFSVTYVLTGGVIGERGAGSGLSVGFLGMIRVAMITLWFLYYIYGKSKTLKLFMFILMSELFWIAGFRYAFVIIAWAFLSLACIRKKKRPNIVLIIALLICGILFFGVLENARNGIRSGAGIDLSGYKYALDAVLGNFGIYKTFYAVIKAVPDLTPFVFGEQIVFYTIVLMVPRLIWPGKPAPVVSQPIRYGISEQAVLEGDAYPNVGEYYHSCGLLGVSFFMAIYGLWNRSLVRSMRNGTTTANVAMYSILVGANFQLFIRGYTPTNFYMLLFMVVPFLVMKLGRNIDSFRGEG